ncbi:hypothetical protein HDU92_004169 [Lobulomyces angularis]|nr:hypothetical protein HDU92_004169 [Lobulomyces angularis]
MKFNFNILLTVFSLSGEGFAYPSEVIADDIFIQQSMALFKSQVNYTDAEFAATMQKEQDQKKINIKSLINTDAAKSVVLNGVDQTTFNNLRYNEAYAAAAYCLRNLWEWKCGARCDATPGNKIVVHFDPILTNIVGFVSVNPNDKAIIVGIRGTLSIRNSILDAQILLTDWNYHDAPAGSKVNLGFINGYESVQNEIRSAISKLIVEYPTFDLKFIGHSLGANVATLAAVDIVALYPQLLSKSRVYTYGMMRPGNAVFADYVTNKFKGRFFRATHQRDIAPHFPPKDLGFKHISNEFWINRSDRKLVACNDDNRESPDCANSQWPFLFGVVPNLLDHVNGYFDFNIGPWC